MTQSLRRVLNIALLVSDTGLTWIVSGFLLPPLIKSISHFPLLPSWPIIWLIPLGPCSSAKRILFGCNLITSCGSHVTASGMSIMIPRCIRHGQTVKVLVMFEPHVPVRVPDSISSSRHTSAPCLHLSEPGFGIIQICFFLNMHR